MLAVGEHKNSVNAIELKPVLRDLDGAWRQIDAGAACTTTRKLQQVRSHPTTDFEQLRPTKVFKLHQSRHPRRVLFISIALHLIEKIARPKFMLAVVLRATWILAPLLTRPEFFLRQPCQSC